VDLSVSLASLDEPEGLKVKQRESRSFNQIKGPPDLEMRSLQFMMAIQFLFVAMEKVFPVQRRVEKTRSLNQILRTMNQIVHAPSSRKKSHINGVGLASQKEGEHRKV
jgi:hypothetical protein